MDALVNPDIRLAEYGLRVEAHEDGAVVLGQLGDRVPGEVEPGHDITEEQLLQELQAVNTKSSVSTTDLHDDTPPGPGNRPAQLVVHHGRP
ncbi:hypothetical protein [Nonomuraea solani]|uniref:hypothetical protein n=1 Tax=Nonomuraea solani TaxID=1144553 RepID=UPI000CDE5FF0|nr:hypothetical protein [Nonomuraea solani]